MIKKIITIGLSILLIAPSAQAAVEYFRFQGHINSSYNPSSPVYDPDFDIAAGQFVYFDFAVESSLYANEPELELPTNGFFDAAYLGGTIAGPSESHLETILYPEIFASALNITKDLYVGTFYYATLWDDVDYNDKSIRTWKVGDEMSLLDWEDGEESPIGSLTLTHLSANPPPPIPVPAAAWLFGSALIGLAEIKRKK